MTTTEWEQMNHFSPDENWGDPTEMSFNLLKRLDALREFCGNPIVIDCGYATNGHTKNSQHYLGKAADFHIVGVSLINQYLLAERFNFGGIGVYPGWNNPGLHCDVRYKDEEQPQDRWARINGRYVILTEKVLKKLIKTDWSA